MPKVGNNANQYQNAAFGKVIAESQMFVAKLE